MVSGVTSQGGGPCPSGNMVESQDLSVDSGTGEEDELIMEFDSGSVTSDQSVGVASAIYYNTQLSLPQSHSYLLLGLKFTSNI